MNSLLLAFAALDARLATECRLLSLRRHELAHAAAAQDHIAQTLDYDFVREVIAAAVGSRHHELQETLCDAVLAAVMQRPEVQAARVATRKPDVYPDSASVGVERVAVKPW